MLTKMVFCVLLALLALVCSACEYRTAIEWHGQTGIDNTTATRMATKHEQEKGER